MGDWPREPSEDSVERFAEDLKALRMATGHSIRNVASHVHASRDSIHQAERGRRLPSVAITGEYVKGVGGSEQDISRWKERNQRLRQHLKQPHTAAIATAREDDLDPPPQAHATDTSQGAYRSTDQLPQDSVPVAAIKIDDSPRQGVRRWRLGRDAVLAPIAQRGRHPVNRLLIAVLLPVGLAVAASAAPNQAAEDGVVQRVLDAGDPGLAYRDLDLREKRMFDEKMLPRSYRQSPPKISETRSGNYTCYDATSETTALAASGDPVYSFTVAGYWCAQEGIIPPKKKEARTMPVRLHAGGWRLSKSEAGSRVADDGSTAFIRDNYTFELPGIVSEQIEKRYIIGSPTGSVCVSDSGYC